MNTLIDELKKEHREITNTLKKLQDPNTPLSQKSTLLNQSKDMLLSHLSKEDDKLYPFLKEKAQTDTILQKTLDTFGQEMDKITKFVIEFYNKYSNSNLMDKEEFSKNLAKMIVTLKDRILKEEIAIYKKYEELQK